MGATGGPQRKPATHRKTLPSSRNLQCKHPLERGSPALGSRQPPRNAVPNTSSASERNPAHSLITSRTGFQEQLWRTRRKLAQTLWWLATRGRAQPHYPKARKESARFRITWGDGQTAPRDAKPTSDRDAHWKAALQSMNLTHYTSSVRAPEGAHDHKCARNGPHRNLSLRLSRFGSPSLRISGDLYARAGRDIDHNAGCPPAAKRW